MNLSKTINELREDTISLLRTRREIERFEGYDAKGVTTNNSGSHLYNSVQSNSKMILDFKTKEYSEKYKDVFDKIGVFNQNEFAEFLSKNANIDWTPTTVVVQERHENFKDHEIYSEYAKDSFLVKQGNYIFDNIEVKQVRELIKNGTIIHLGDLTPKNKGETNLNINMLDKLFFSHNHLQIEGFQDAVWEYLNDSYVKYFTKAIEDKQNKLNNAKQEFAKYVANEEQLINALKAQFEREGIKINQDLSK